MLSLSFRSDAGYLTRYAAEHDEPPGRWFGAGAEDLGLTGEVDEDSILGLYHELDSGLPPHEHLSFDGRVAEALAGEGGEVTPERRAEIELVLRRPYRKYRTDRDVSLRWIDASFSAAKSWSVLWVALSSEGRPYEANELWEAWMEGVEAGIGYFQDNAGLVLAQSRWLDRRDWVMSLWRHHSDGDANPDLHVHVAILSWVRCGRDTWGALSEGEFAEARPAAQAIGERVAEESAIRRLGISFARRRPEDESREIVGIDQALIDTFSTRQSGSRR